MRSKHQELLRSTKLRHHIATLSQILNFKDNELDILTNFLGHDIRTYIEYYRLPEESLQVAKMYTIVYPWYLSTFIAEFLGLMDKDASTFQLLDFSKHVKDYVKLRRCRCKEIDSKERTILNKMKYLRRLLLSIWEMVLKRNRKTKDSLIRLLLNKIETEQGEIWDRK